MSEPERPWALFVFCKGCGKAIRLGKAPSPEQSADPKQGPRTVKCGLCGQSHEYAGREIARQED